MEELVSFICRRLSRNSLVQYNVFEQTTRGKKPDFNITRLQLGDKTTETRRRPHFKLNRD